jgi:hypothetical protein
MNEEKLKELQDMRKKGIIKRGKLTLEDTLFIHDFLNELDERFKRNMNLIVSEYKKRESNE